MLIQRPSLDPTGILFCLIVFYIFYILSKNYIKKKKNVMYNYIDNDNIKTCHQIILRKKNTNHYFKR